MQILDAIRKTAQYLPSSSIPRRALIAGGDFKVPKNRRGEKMANEAPNYKRPQSKKDARSIFNDGRRTDANSLFSQGECVEDAPARPYAKNAYVRVRIFPRRHAGASCVRCGERERERESLHGRRCCLHHLSFLPSLRTWFLSSILHLREPTKFMGLECRSLSLSLCC